MKSWSGERNRLCKIALKKIKPSKVAKKIEEIGQRNKQKEERHAAVRWKGRIDFLISWKGLGQENNDITRGNHVALAGKVSAELTRDWAFCFVLYREISPQGKEGWDGICRKALTCLCLARKTGTHCINASEGANCIKGNKTTILLRGKGQHKNGSYMTGLKKSERGAKCCIYS